MNLETIKGKFSGDQLALARATFKIESITIGLKSCVLRTKLDPPKILFLETASSTNKVSWLGLVGDIALLKRKGLLVHVKTLLKAHPKA